MACEAALKKQGNYSSAQRRSWLRWAMADYVREPRRGPATTAAPHGPAAPARGQPAKHLNTVTVPAAHEAEVLSLTGHRQ
jgi:hypothetical protein